MSAESGPISAVRQEGGGVIVDLQGEIDLHQSPQLHERLVEVCKSKPKVLVLNLAEVAYMDSSGVGTLVHTYRTVSGYQGRMALAGLQDRVRSVFEISRLDKYFQIFDSVEAALTA